MSTEQEILVEVKGISKRFSRSLKRGMIYGLRDVFSALLGLRNEKNTLRKSEFWAIKDISFTLRRGECLGLIGRNGAGKSTLLKMLNGLVLPDQGSISIRGKVGALIELGAGFNPILTGRENIYVNGQLLGLTRKEIDSKMDAILQFAEIGEFIDSPVQNYSSGMKVRLGFAVAAQMEPDVLIVDEVLAVGDLGFILKCFATIDEIMKNTAVIFVSHSMQQVSRVCTSVMMLENGKAIYHSDNVSKGIDLYYSRFGKSGNTQVVFDNGGEVALVAFQFDEHAGTEPFQMNRLEDLKMSFSLRVSEQIAPPYLIVTVYDKEQRPVGIAQCEEPLSATNISRRENGSVFYNVNLTLPRVNLSKGLYFITLAVTGKYQSSPLLRLHSIGSFQVISKIDVWPPVEFEARWS